MITIEYIPHRKIYAIDTNTNFYEHDISVYETILSDLKNNMLKNNLPQVYYYNAGSSIKKEDFVNNNYVSDKVFVFVDNDFPYSENIKTIESGMYACIYLDDFDDEVEYGKKLLEYCNSNGYIISGDYICEVITEFNVFSEKKRSMYLRLQVLLTFR